MMTFSSIKASVRVEKVFTSGMITRSFYMEIVIIKSVICCESVRAPAGINDRLRSSGR